MHSSVSMHLRRQKTKILTNIRLIKRHSMYSDKRKEEERYPYFFAIQITVVNSLVSFHTCLVAWRLLCWIYFCEIHVLIFCFTMIIIFFKMVHISERFRKRNLEIKYVSIQSTWGRLGSLINVTLASWQKCKQVCMKSRPCRATWWIVISSNQRWSQLCEMVWYDCKSSKIIDIVAG